MQDQRLVGAIAAVLENPVARTVADLESPVVSRVIRVVQVVLVNRHRLVTRPKIVATTGILLEIHKAKAVVATLLQVGLIVLL